MAKTILIQGEAFEVTEPYNEGHTITLVEARVLNQVRAENIRNNNRKKVQAAIEAGTVDAVRQEVAEYDKNYTFSTPGEGVKRTLDPIEREARRMARDQIRAKLAESGKKFKDVDPESLENAIEQLSTRDDFVQAAKKVVNARSKFASPDLSDIQLPA